MDKLDCNVIRDLLPSYIDRLTSKESNELIEGHLEDCAECGEMLSALSQTVAVDTKEANREIDYMKKIKAMRKTFLLLTVLICTLIFGTIAAIGIKIFVIGSPVSFSDIDSDKTDNYSGIATKFNEEMNELTIYGEITLHQTEFSGIKVEEAKGLVDAYNVTIYGAERLSDSKEYNRKFEKTIKIPDDNNVWSIYSIGEIPQDTVMFWSNREYVDKKAEKQLQKLTDFLTEHKGFQKEKGFLEYICFQEILSDPCYTFFWSNGDYGWENFEVFEYAVSEDCERIYYCDPEKGQWLLL